MSQLRRLCAVLLLGVSAQALAAATTSANPDPWEGFNRKIFTFDMQLDHYVLKPAAIGYRKVTPGWGRGMVHNFFANLKDMRSTFNALLQARFGQAGSNFSRVLLNTTLGVGGLFDVASDAGLTSYSQDFGLTLARWGFDSGPYLVLPFLGPSTVRDGIGWVPDIYFWPPHYLQDQWINYGQDALYAVSTREELLDMEKSIVGDKYIFIRNYYLQNRALLAGKKVVDDFGAGAPAPSGDDGW